jgi:hypothetical protein
VGEGRSSVSAWLQRRLAPETATEAKICRLSEQGVGERAAA